jgi:hypothetical protein
MENARWEGLSEVDKLAEIKVHEEIKTLRNKQKNDDLVAKELMESSKRQAAAAERQAQSTENALRQQVSAARDAARAQEQQAAAAKDLARTQDKAARDLAGTQEKAANTCVYCRVSGPVGPCHKSPHGQHRFG